MYSHNDMNFNSSRILPHGNTVVGQNAETIVGRKDLEFFALCGQDVRGNLNGVAISTDGGANFTFQNISSAISLTRYASYPSRTVWYVSSGDFTSAGMDDPSLVTRVSNVVSIHKRENGELFYHASATPRTPVNSFAPPTPAPAFSGELLKTSDAGKTWTRQFATEDFYFNGIDCASENHCCAVGESQGTSTPGARIFCTTDGQTWTQVVYMEGSSNSLIAIRAVSEMEWWAGGGYLQPKTFDANFPHTTDGWKTYTNNTLPKVYINDLDMIDADHGWASTFDVSGVSGLAKYS
jgi:hypothetical protein